MLEVLVHLDRFRNVDLCYQAAYALRFSCFYEKGPERIWAVPLCYNSVNQPQKAQPHFLKEGNCNQANCTITSRTFMIRYGDEVVKMNDTAVFSLEMELDKNFNRTAIYVKVDLMYRELNPSMQLGYFMKSFKFEGELKPTVTKLYKVAYPTKGLHEYLPVFFTREWFSCVDSVLHVVFHDYSETHPEEFLSKLFSNKKKLVGGMEIDEKYQHYVSPLAQVHQSTTRALDSLLEKCFFEEEVEVPESLKLPLGSQEEDNSFANKVGSHSLNAVGLALIEEVKLISGYVREAFEMLKDLATRKPHEVCKVFKQKYEEIMMESYEEYIVRKVNTKWEFDLTSEDKLKETHHKASKSLRKDLFAFKFLRLNVQEVDFFAEIKNHPIIFEEIYYASENSSVYSRDQTYTRNPSIENLSDLHVIILVHGFQGTSLDLKVLKNYIGLLYPKCMLVDSYHNENNTGNDLEDQGFRLAKEVIGFLSRLPSGPPPQFSFIGHSLGGLVIRAALPYLECLKDRMHMYMSLSSPHLGFMYATKILDAGMWFLKRMKNTLSIKQLCFEDFHLKEGTKLFQLSKAEGLEWFQYVVLVSSAQDDYAPYYSARIEVPSKVSKDKQNGNFFIQMAHNLLSRLNVHKVVKIDVNFKLKRSIDTIIGRSAHLQLLENEAFIKMLVYRFPEFFA